MSAVPQLTNHQVHVDLSLAVPTRDGLSLRTDVQRPAGDLRVPSVLMRTPYGTGTVALLQLARHLASRGWAAVFQNVRGRYGSEGKFEPFVNEKTDGEDTLGWLADQPWSDGRVLNLGISYSTYCAARLVGNRQDIDLLGTVAIVPMVVPRDHFYQGNAFRLHWALAWAQLIAGSRQEPLDLEAMVQFRQKPIEQMPSLLGFPEYPWTDWLNSKVHSDYWRRVDAGSALSIADHPTLVIGGWYDFSLFSTLWTHHKLVAGGNSGGLILGPWEHNQIFDVLLRGLTAKADPSDDAERLLAERFSAFIESRLLDSPRQPATKPVVLWRSRGHEKGEWILSDSESPKAKSLICYRLGLDLTPTVQPAYPSNDQVYWNIDPDSTTWTQGGRLWSAPGWCRAGAWISRLQTRPDRLQLRGGTSLKPVPIHGPCRLCLAVISDSGGEAMESGTVDYSARLFDLAPDGHARWLADSIQRACANHQGVLELSFGFLCHVLPIGHRVLLELSGESFPVFDLPSADQPRRIALAESHLELTVDSAFCNHHEAPKEVQPCSTT